MHATKEKFRMHSESENQININTKKTSNEKISLSRLNSSLDMAEKN